MAYLLNYERKLTRTEGTEAEPKIVEYIQGEALYATDDTYDIQYAEAMKRSYNGVVTAVELEDVETAPSQLDQIEAQVTYTAMMTDTLLEV